MGSLNALSRAQTICDPMDCSPPGSSVHGILQARILQWVWEYNARCDLLGEGNYVNYFIFERISRSCVVPAKSEVNEVWEILQINISRFIQLVHFKNKMVVQCLSPCLPIQGLRVRSLVGELTSHLHHSQKAKPSNRSSIGWLSLEPTHCSNGVHRVRHD